MGAGTPNVTEPSGSPVELGSLFRPVPSPVLRPPALPNLPVLRSFTLGGFSEGAGSYYLRAPGPQLEEYEARAARYANEQQDHLAEQRRQELREQQQRALGQPSSFGSSSSLSLSVPDPGVQLISQDPGPLALWTQVRGLKLVIHVPAMGQLGVPGRLEIFAIEYKETRRDGRANRANGAKFVVASLPPLGYCGSRVGTLLDLPCGDFEKLAVESFQRGTRSADSVTPVLKKATEWFDLRGLNGYLFEHLLETATQQDGKAGDIQFDLLTGGNSHVLGQLLQDAGDEGLRLFFAANEMTIHEATTAFTASSADNWLPLDTTQVLEQYGSFQKNAALKAGGSRTWVIDITNHPGAHTKIATIMAEVSARNAAISRQAVFRSGPLGVVFHAGTSLATIRGAQLLLPSSSAWQTSGYNSCLVHTNQEMSVEEVCTFLRQLGQIVQDETLKQSISKVVYFPEQLRISAALRGKLFGLDIEEADIKKIRDLELQNRDEEALAPLISGQEEFCEEEEQQPAGATAFADLVRAQAEKGGLGPAPKRQKKNEDVVEKGKISRTTDDVTGAVAAEDVRVAVQTAFSSALPSASTPLSPDEAGNPAETGSGSAAAGKSDSVIGLSTWSGGDASKQQGALSDAKASNQQQEKVVSQKDENDEKGQIPGSSDDVGVAVASGEEDVAVAVESAISTPLSPASTPLSPDEEGASLTPRGATPPAPSDFNRCEKVVAGVQARFRKTVSESVSLSERPGYAAQGTDESGEKVWRFMRKSISYISLELDLEDVPLRAVRAVVLDSPQIAAGLSSADREQLARLQNFGDASGSAAILVPISAETRNFRRRERRATKQRRRASASQSTSQQQKEAGAEQQEADADVGERVDGFRFYLYLIIMVYATAESQTGYLQAGNPPA
eukprot:g12522.t1